jgi:catechol 2,3-dioxygenase-like lactoylglutathione lyase family enzyme
MPVQLDDAIPILRIFDEEKAREFYLGFLGFSVDWEHRFGDNFPLYMQVSRGGLRLHLSEHHGDASPGVRVFVTMHGIEELHAELKAKNYKYNKPGINTVDWGREITAHDPFGNRITFCEQSR